MTDLTATTSAAVEATVPTVKGITTIGVPVRDQDRAIDFYVGTLGLVLRLDAPLEQLGSRWIEVGPEAGGPTIALVKAGDQLPTGVETGIHLSTDDAAGFRSALERQGVEVGELLLWDGVPPMFTFRDPDGNGLEVVQ